MFKQQGKELLSQALITLWSHKFRSFLTVLGVVIGTAVVIAVGSLLSGLEAGFKEQIEQFGTNVAFVSRLGGGPRHGDLTEEERQRKPITLEDAIALSQLPSVTAASPILPPPGLPPTVKFRGNEVRTPQLRGVWASYASTREVTIERGRFFTDVEDQHSIEVCIIGYEIADRLLAGYEPLEKEILIGNKVFKVIGVLEKSKSPFGGPPADSLIFIPYSIMHAMYPMQLEHFVALGASQGELEKMIDDARDLLRRKRQVPYDKPDSFVINTPSGIIESFNQMIMMVSMIVIPIVSVALLVGGIGVMNIMLVSVTERTKEIGVRRAIGAKRSDIIWQFLLEASTLTGLGGIIGIAFGFLVSLLINLLLPSLPSRVPLIWVVIGFSVSVAIGLIAGMYPAIKASRLDPIEALRYE
ncbi:MAG: ABC transporter permease [Acidobacteria bacterium]|nr:ABC transporter permease [Acidobacteriota bacterium]